MHLALSSQLSVSSAHSSMSARESMRLENATVPACPTENDHWQYVEISETLASSWSCSSVISVAVPQFYSR